MIGMPRSITRSTISTRDDFFQRGTQLLHRALFPYTCCSKNLALAPLTDASMGARIPWGACSAPRSPQKPQIPPQNAQNTVYRERCAALTPDSGPPTFVEYGETWVV